MLCFFRSLASCPLVPLFWRKVIYFPWHCYALVLMLFTRFLIGFWCCSVSYFSFALFLFVYLGCCYFFFFLEKLLENLRKFLIAFFVYLFFQRVCNGGNVNAREVQTDYPRLDEIFLKQNKKFRIFIQKNAKERKKKKGKSSKQKKGLWWPEIPMCVRN